jgi:hypothetical protein
MFVTSGKRLADLSQGLEGVATRHFSLPLPRFLKIFMQDLCNWKVRPTF